ncbi:MAG: PQQ-binding-like beta-propeller repeat protein [Planctomycetes bacterium]|nr:PQQ-binding-like beta-propeller repeat protein [Planctomycetota bacterium]
MTSLQRPIRGLVACLVISSVACADAEGPAAPAEPIAVDSTDWPWWRGPNRNGVAARDQHPPLEWSESNNVLWHADVPGRGHGSPSVVGEQVFLATAELDRGVQSVLCYDRDSGAQLWQTDVHSGGLTEKGNQKASLASSTVACDGRRVFINFLNDDAVYTTALSREGKILWQTKISDYVVHQGYGSSPALYGSLVIVSADNKGGGAVAALDRASGRIVWKHDRPSTPNYASPVILSAAGRDQLVLTGCDLVASFDPTTGESLWEVEGATTECVTSTVTDGRLVFTSGGYPKNHISAVAADGSGELVWENTVRVYVPSLLVRDGHLYAVTDSGVAMCWKCDTGDAVWKGRLGGTFSSSPVLVGEHIYAVNEAGRTFIFKATPEEFAVVAENDLGDEVFATPAICGDRIYMRVATMDEGRRQELLYCLGNQ